MYKTCPNKEDGENAECVQRISDSAFIPFAPDNTDYQAYLEWIEDGNTPEAAD